MIKLNCLLVSMCIVISLPAQIKNPGFEIIHDTVSDGWNFKKASGYIVAADSTIYFEGRRSLKISNSENRNDTAFSNFNQTITIKTESPRKYCLSAYIKKDKVSGNPYLVARTMVTENNIITGLAVANILEGSGNWEKIKALFIADRDVTIRISGGLKGTGTLWFDVIKLEDITANDITPARKEAEDLIKQFMDTVHHNSLFADSLNWTTLTNDVSELSKGIKSMEDAHLVLDYIISSLRLAGDSHSHIVIDRGNVTVTQANQIKTTRKVPEGKYIGNNIGYIKIPEFNTDNDTASRMFSDMEKQIIKQIDQKHKINGWIVDLRDDRGGSMFSMIEGLLPLLGYDTLGYFVSNKEKEPWFISKEDWNPPYFLKNSSPKIAVLIGPATGSSGEATAISFIGKTNTKLFGQRTIGLTSANERYKLKDDSYLFLAVSIEADRNMKLYRAGIDPDVIVNDNSDKKEDACIAAAKMWILEK